MYRLAIQWLEDELQRAINENRFSDTEYIIYILERLRYND